MKIQLIFEMKRIPLTYRLGVLSIVKEMIRNGDDEYYQRLFVDKHEKMKPFAYASFIRDLVIEGEFITGKEFRITISSPHYEFIMQLMNGSKKGNNYFIQNEKITLKQKMLLPEKRITKNEVIFKTLSPVLIETKEGKPVLATGSKFAEEFQYTAHLIIQEIFGTEPKQPIKVMQTMMSKQVIKENLHQKQNSPLFLTANKGLLHVKGDPKDLQKLYEAGIGLRRSLGFGLLDIEKEVI